MTEGENQPNEKEKGTEPNWKFTGPSIRISPSIAELFRELIKRDTEAQAKQLDELYERMMKRYE